VISDIVVVIALACDIWLGNPVATWTCVNYLMG
jgi:hypothetical protein